MRIAVNSRFLLKGKLEGIGWFTHEIIRRVVLNHPEHQFIFFFDRQPDPQFIYAPNVEVVVLQPPARHPILWMIWFEVSVRFALKKYKADCFISTDGFLSLGSRIPTLLVIHDLAFEHYPEHLPNKFRWYLSYFGRKFAQRANRIVAVSEYTRQDIQSTYGISPDRIDVVYNGANPLYQPLPFEQKQQIRQKYADGSEYFVFAGALHPRKNILNLLKAFALFKKRQRSQMKLLIIGRFAWESDAIRKALENHPFKGDVIRYEYMQVEELSQVIGSAYGLTFVSLFEGFGIPVLEALQCGIPGIVSQTSSLPEVAGNTALYVNPESPEDIAEKMCSFYKDEHLRQQLAASCAQQAARFSWDQSAHGFYDSLIRMMELA